MFRSKKRLLLFPSLILLFIAISAIGRNVEDVGQANKPVFITHGPILGRPGANQMGVWARTSTPGAFRVRYGTRVDNLEYSSAPVETALSNDNTGWILLRGLKPDTKYYYEVVTRDEVPMPKNRGSFRTLPIAEQFLNSRHNPDGLFNFSFEVGCGNAQNVQYSIGPDAPSFQTMLRELEDTVHFAIQTGDFIYEEQRAFSAEEWCAELGLSVERMPNILRISPTLAGVWENYKIYLERSNYLAAWHRTIPSYFMFDDHEILNDVLGGSVPGHRSRPACFRDIGIKAWYDYLGWSNPVAFSQDIHLGRGVLKAGSDILSDTEADFTALDLGQMTTLTVHWGTPTAGVWDPELDRADKGDPNAGVYQIVRVLDEHRIQIHPRAKINSTSSYSIGRRNYYSFSVSNADFFVLDTRSHRGIPAMDGKRVKGQTMLGPEQKEWLKEQMSTSKADILFIVSTITMMIPHTGKGGYIDTVVRTDESWTGFLEEREELIKFWESLKKPVIILSGDLHNAFSIKIADSIWEFTASPHTSGNHNLHSESSRPINGPYEFGGRECEIRWSTFFLDDVQTYNRRQTVYTVIKVNNVMNNQNVPQKPRWVAYPHPQVIVQFYDGMTGELLYAESVVANL